MDVKVVDDIYREGRCHPMQLLSVQHEDEVSHYLMLDGDDHLVVAYLFNNFHEEPEQLFGIPFDPRDPSSLENAIEVCFDGEDTVDVLVNLISVGVLDPLHRPLGIAPMACGICM
jgi:hypothetical protein